MSVAVSARSPSGWSRLKRNLVAFAEAIELSEAEVQAHRLARIEQRLAACEARLADVLDEKGARHDCR